MGQAFLVNNAGSGELDNVINGILEEYYAYSDTISPNTFISFFSDYTYKTSTQNTGFTGWSYSGIGLGQHTERDYYRAGTSQTSGTYCQFQTESRKISDDTALLITSGSVLDEDGYRASGNAYTNTRSFYLIKFYNNTLSIITQIAFSDSYNKILKINDNKYIYCYSNGSYYFVKVINITTTGITVSSPAQSASTNINAITGICKLTDDKIVVIGTYGSSDTNYVHAALFTINATSATYNNLASQSIAGYSTYSSYGYHCRAVALNPSLIAIMTGYSSNTNYVQIIPLSISNTTLTFLSSYVKYFPSAISTTQGVEQMYRTSDNSFAVIMNEYNTSYTTLYEYNVTTTSYPVLTKKQTISGNTSYRHRIRVTDNLYFYVDINNNTLYGTFQDLRGDYAKYTPYTLIDGLSNSCVWVKKILYYDDNNMIIFYIDASKVLQCKKIKLNNNAIEVSNQKFNFPITSSYYSSLNFGADLAIEKTSENKFIIIARNGSQAVNIYYYYFNGTNLQLYGQDLLTADYSNDSNYSTCIFDIIPINNNKNVLIFYSYTTKTSNNRGIQVKIYNINAGSFKLESTIDILPQNNSYSYYRLGKAIKLTENDIILLYSLNNNSIYGTGLTYNSVIKVEDALINGQISGITKTICSSTTKGQVFRLNI